MVLFLQLLLTTIIAQDIAVRDGISRMIVAESRKRRELFISCIGDFDFDGCVDEIEEGLDDFTDTVKNGWDDITDVADDVLNAVGDVAQVGINALEDIPVDEIVNVVGNALEEVWESFQCAPVDCLTDFTINGCMPSDGKCIIVYGQECLSLSAEVGTYAELSYSASAKKSAKDYDGYIEGEVGVTMWGSAKATVETRAQIELHLDSNPRIGVRFEAPSIRMEAGVGFDLEANVEIQSTEKKIYLSKPKIVFTRAFMAGPIPVLVSVTAQPVAILSAQGSVDASGSITYKFNGNFGFNEVMYVELGLLDFEASHNFDTITMAEPEFINEGFNFDMEMNSEIQLDVKLGVEFAFQLYNAVEFNLLPMIGTKLVAHGGASASGNSNGATGSASADLTLCLRGEFDSYFDWAAVKGKGRRELETLNLLASIEDSCDQVLDFVLGENCFMNELLQDVLDICEIATDILGELGFPATINMPSLTDLDIPALPTPRLCYDTSIGTSKSVAWEDASSEGTINQVYSTGSYGVMNGKLGPDVSVTSSCSGKYGDEYVCGGKNKYIKWNVAFGSSDFVVESEFRADSVSGTALAFVLWSGNTMYYIGLDGGGNTHFYQGGAWGGAILTEPTNLDAWTTQHIQIKRINNLLYIKFDGKSWIPLALTDDVTAVGWRPWRNTVRVKTLHHYNPHVNYGIINGQLDSSVSITGLCSGASGEYVCGGKNKWIKWYVDFGSSDFVVESTFKATSVSGTALSFILWSGNALYYIGLDGSGNTFFHQGQHGAEWGGPYILGPTNLDTTRYQKIELRRTGNSLNVIFDGHEWSPLSLNVDITAVGWRPWRNSINIKDLLHY